jgi:hypothetical protein
MAFSRFARCIQFNSSQREGLLLCWHSLLVQPGNRSPIKNMMMKLTTKSQIDDRQPEPMMIANKKMRIC